MSKAKLQALAGLAGMIRDRELGRLAVLAKEAQGIRGQIDAHARAVADRSAQLAASGPDAASSAGADAKWQAHLDREKSRLMSELAGVLARREKAKAEAAKALGRADVLDRLADRHD